MIISLFVKVPIFIGYIGVAVWFFCHAAMETALVISTRHKLKNKVSKTTNMNLCVSGETL